MAGDNFSNEYPKIHEMVEALLNGDLSLDECDIFADRVKERTAWLRNYWENEDN